jgi:hypothetical protein
VFRCAARRFPLPTALLLTSARLRARVQRRGKLLGLFFLGLQLLSNRQRLTRGSMQTVKDFVQSRLRLAKGDAWVDAWLARSR